MTLVLTNDDGIDAPGIRALRQAVDENSIVVAPRDPYSGCGHQVTTTNSIRVQQRSESEFAIAGTPADCVRVALKHLCPTATLVLSGINHGGNLGVDAYISGTVAAVREAAFHGVTGIAISQYRAKGREIDWVFSANMTAKVIAKLLSLPSVPGTFWNVNLPHPQSGDREPQLVFCQPCIRPLPVSFTIDGEYLTYSGKYELRDRTSGTDVDTCFSGNIAITQIHL